MSTRNVDWDAEIYLMTPTGNKSVNSPNSLNTDTAILLGLLMGSGLPLCHIGI